MMPIADELFQNLLTEKFLLILSEMCMEHLTFQRIKVDAMLNLEIDGEKLLVNIFFNNSLCIRNL